MGGEEGLVDEDKVLSPAATGAQVNGVVHPDEVESIVTPHHTATTPA